MKKIFILATSLLLLTGISEAQWSFNGTHIYNSNTGNVGIGTNVPATLFEVGKNMTEPAITVHNLGGAGGATYSMVDNASGANWKFKTTNTGGFKIRDHSNGLDVFMIEPNSSANALYIKGGGSVGMGTSTPNNSAILDLQSTTKGFLPPRMTDPQMQAIASPATGLMVYSTGSQALFSYNGAAWIELSAGNNAWNVDGNSGTDPVNHFIGTTDEQPLRFKVNNAWAGEIHPTSGNLFLGMGAGQANTIGEANTAIGEHSLFSNSEGALNTACGYQALYSNTYGFSNTANGYQTLFSNTSGINNTASGLQALYSNTTGFSNTASGGSALFHNITGNYNTAYGEQALYYNSEGNSNTATGNYALFVNSSGSFNTANGADALFSNTIGNYNTANGVQALFSNNTGISNTSSGYQALYSNTYGGGNTANGVDALYSNTSGAFNTASGYFALYNNTGGSYNTALGYGSGTHPSAGNVYNTVSIGNNGLLNGYQNQVIIGNGSTGFIGGVVTWSVVSDARIKNTVTEDVKGLDFISRLRPVTYHISQKAITTLTGNKETPDFPGKYDGEKVKYSGFIAQEVEQAAKEAGYDFSGYAAPKNEWGLYTISYEQFVVPLVKAVQELSAINEAQKITNEELKAQNEQLLHRIEILENK